MSKSYKDIGNVPLEFQDETLLDHVVEMVGRFQKKSSIAAKLREDFPEISNVVVSLLISRARAKIRETLDVDPNDYRSCILECLQQIISGKTKHRDRLKALEMLADFTGVKLAAMESPESYAQRVVAAIKAADESVAGTALIEENTNEQSSQTQRDGQEESETTPQASSQQE